MKRKLHGDRKESETASVSKAQRMVRASPRLAKDMNTDEENELARLEGRLLPLAVGDVEEAHTVGSSTSSSIRREAHEASRSITHDAHEAVSFE